MKEVKKIWVSAILLLLLCSTVFYAGYRYGQDKETRYFTSVFRNAGIETIGDFLVAQRAIPEYKLYLSTPETSERLFVIPDNYESPLNYVYDEGVRSYHNMAVNIRRVRNETSLKSVYDFKLLWWNRDN